MSYKKLFLSMAIVSFAFMASNASPGEQTQSTNTDFSAVQNILMVAQQQPHSWCYPKKEVCGSCGGHAYPGVKCCHCE